MARQISDDIAQGDAALLAPVMIDAARAHAAALERYLVPRLGAGWLAELERRAAALDQALDQLAAEERETRELSREVAGILDRLPGWKAHIGRLAELAYDDHHPKRDLYRRDLGRGKGSDLRNVGPARDFLQDVVPEVKAHRDALLAAGGDAETIDLGEQWAAQLDALKVEITREKREDAEAGTSAGQARDALVAAIGLVVTASNAAAFAHPEAEEAIAFALDEGERRIRRAARTLPPTGTPPPDPQDPPDPEPPGDPAAS